MCPPPTEFTDSNVLTTSWVTDAPIRKLNAVEAKRASDWIAEQASEIRAAAKRDIQAIKDEEIPRSTAEEAFDKIYKFRLDETEERALIIGETDIKDSLDIYGYFLSGKVVGLMSIAPEKSIGAIYIENLTGHPLARNVGDILIEYAVQLAQNLGYSGKIKLVSLPKSSEFYSSIGFKGACESNTFGSSTLDPNGNTQWSDLGGKWKLKNLRGRSVGNNYLT